MTLCRIHYSSIAHVGQRICTCKCKAHGTRSLGYRYMENIASPRVPLPTLPRYPQGFIVIVCPRLISQLKSAILCKINLPKLHSLDVTTLLIRAA